MSSIALSHGSNENGLSYGANVCRAFRSFLAALFAVKPAQEMRQEVILRDRLAVLRLARQYEALSPNLAAELRVFASRS